MSKWFNPKTMIRMMAAYLFFASFAAIIFLLVAAFIARPLAALSFVAGIVTAIVAMQAWHSRWSRSYVSKLRTFTHA